MGVHGLWQLLQSTGQPVTLESLEGKTLAVDVSIWLNKAAKGMRDKFGNPVYNGHLILIFHRICKLLFYNIKPVFVFDGGVPELKKRTIAARRERKLAAEGMASKASQKMMHNYLKGKALEAVTGQRGPRPVKISRNDGQDIFDLPPIPASSQPESSSDDENVDAETEWMAGMKNEEVEKMFENIGSVDFESEEFKAFPPEIQHELLTEMKDSYRRRYNKRKSQPMPEEAHDFSDFQLKNLFRRGKITKTICDVRKTMNSRCSGPISEFDEESYFGKNAKSIEAKRVASEDKQHYILMKKSGKKGGENVLFNADLEIDKIDIYKETRIKENFGRLERDPAHFKEASIDNWTSVTFVSDSSEDSDFDYDREITFRRPREVSEGEINAELERLANDQARGSSSLQFDLGSSSELGRTSAGRLSDNAGIDNIDLVSGESEVELLDLTSSPNAKVQRLAVNESLDEEGAPEFGNNMSETAVSVDDTAETNKNEQNLQEITESGTGQEAFVVEDTADKANNEARSPDDSYHPDYNLQSVHEFEVKNSSEASVTCDVSACDGDWETVEKKGEYLNESATLKEKSLSKGLDLSEEVIYSDNEELSAVPKPDGPSQEPLTSVTAVYEEPDSEDVRNFKRDVQGQSFEQLSAIQDSINQEQERLQKERERQTRAAASVGNEEYKDVQELLRLFGIPFIVSPMEAEAQCAILDMTNQTEGSVTDDSDIFLFGGKRVFKNVFNQEKYAEVYTTDNIRHMLYLDREKMIALAFLTGSDYTEGVHGVGAITAMEVLQEFGGEALQPLIKMRQWLDEVKKQDHFRHIEQRTKLKNKLLSAELPKNFPNCQVWEAYVKPTVDWSDEPFEWQKPDLHSIREFAKTRFGWNNSRTDEILLPAIKNVHAAGQQSSLKQYFSTKMEAPGRKVESKRLKRVVNLMRSGPKSETDNSSPDKNDVQAPQASALAKNNLQMPKILQKTVNTKRRIPTIQQFQKRVDKSRAGSRGRTKRPVMPFGARVSRLPTGDKGDANSLQLSGSSSDSDS